MNSTAKPTVYEAVTAQIVAAIESGDPGKWRMPWHTTGGASSSPINVISRKAYRGVNTICLWAAAASKGYTSGEWATFNQWKEKGASVRKGEKATMVVFWKFTNGAAESDADPEPEEKGGARKMVLTRGYWVFNAAQVDGYEQPESEPMPIVEGRDEEADIFFAALGADLKHGGNSACFIPSTDSIRMPDFHQFEHGSDYYSTLGHEHAHWTGAKHRLDRNMTGRFGDAAYAVEELVAELAAAFLCALLGISSEPRPDHAQYIATWLKVLKTDSRAIFTAASKAQAAVDWMNDRSAEGRAQAA